MSKTTFETSVAEAADAATSLLMTEQNEFGWWTGELSTSALSTATAVMALEMARRAEVRTREDLIAGGLQWLADHQNDDGGWGDTVLSHSNISTSMLVNAVFRAAASDDSYQSIIDRSQTYIDQQGGVDAVIQRYGEDHTFSVPILTHCALAGIVGWDRVMPLPFELACVPAKFYNAVRMPVVSYALPALIAIGQVIFRKRPPRNPVVRWIRQRSVKRSLQILDHIQPEHGGFLEATPLTSFVCMSLIGAGHTKLKATERCLDFIEASVRDDGSWPIDTNLTTWVTTLSINALSHAKGDQSTECPLDDEQRSVIRDWILHQQYREKHPYTQAAPGGWAWTDLPGGVPDADDTPGAMLALLNLRRPDESFTDEELQSLEASANWLLDLQNSDGGWPTFCRGWGTLPFDRSSNDLTAHTLRALHEWSGRVTITDPETKQRLQAATSKAVKYLSKTQASDGSWLPLWFGNQWNENEENPLYGTAKVALALCETGHKDAPMTQRAITWLINNQNDDGSWSARRGLPGSVEETSLAVETLCGIPCAESAVTNGTNWLAGRIQDGRIMEASPIGFYFAKLWYFERLYPIIFAVAALRRAVAARREN